MVSSTPVTRRASKRARTPPATGSDLGRVALEKGELQIIEEPYDVGEVDTPVVVVIEQGH